MLKKKLVEKVLIDVLLTKNFSQSFHKKISETYFVVFKILRWKMFNFPNFVTQEQYHQYWNANIQSNLDYKSWRICLILLVIFNVGAKYLPVYLKKFKIMLTTLVALFTF